MGRYSQVFARIGAGLTTIGSVVWLLWPKDISSIINPEPLFAVSVALFVWVSTEFKQNEEFKAINSSPNDLRLARTLLGYHSEQFRTILKDHDFHSTIQPRYVSELGFFLNEVENRHFEFQNRAISPSFQIFIGDLLVFRSLVAQYTVPYSFSGGVLTSVRSPHDINDYDIKESHRAEIAELNSAAWKAWESLTGLVSEIKASIPDAFNDPIAVTWMAPDTWS